MFENILRYRSGRYFWWSVGLLVIGVVLYATHGAAFPPAGDTWQGYVLGISSGVLVVWLALLGVRKRSYSSTLGSVRGWVSAHVYLGLAVLITASLHSNLEMGWNVHSLAYVLLCLVVFSGLFGLYVYINYPRQGSDNRQGGSRDALFAELHEQNQQGLVLALKCSPAVQGPVVSSIERTAIGGGVLAQLFSRDESRISVDGGKLIPHPDQQQAIDLVASMIPRSEKAQEVVALEELLSVLCRRQTILRRLRKDIQLQGWIQAWLYVHVPMTVALLAAIIVHILSVFIYW